MAFRSALLLLAPALPLGLACDGGEDLPGPEGVYWLSVTGETDDEFPPLVWPDLFAVDLIAYDPMVTDYNAQVTVNGAFPDLATVRPTGRGSEVELLLILSVDDYGLAATVAVELVDPEDCEPDFFWHIASMSIRLDGATADGEGTMDMSCIITSDDGPPLAEYYAIFQLDASGKRL